MREKNRLSLVNTRIHIKKDISTNEPAAGIGIESSFDNFTVFIVLIRNKDRKTL